MSEQQKPRKDLLNGIENQLEQVLFASRWVLAPFYFGLAASLVILLIKFCAEFFHLAAIAFTGSDADVILGVLALVDLTLTGSLLIIVIFSGYENFVSKIDHSGHRDWPEWMGTIDFTALKLKLLSSIVAISAIQLLKYFMAVGKVSERELMWLVIIHVVFVISSVLLALSDRIANASGGHGGHSPNAETSSARNGNSDPAGTPPAHAGSAANTVARQADSEIHVASEPSAEHDDAHPHGNDANGLNGANPTRRKLN